MNNKKFISSTLAFMLVANSINVPTALAINSAKIAGISVENFTDIKGHWAEDYMRLAIQNNLITGKSETIAAPNDKLTRAELSAIMVRAFGGGEESNLNSYSDVNESAWYYKELAKAVSLGFISGSNGKLRPNDSISREETFTVVARAFGFLDGTSEDYSMFSDSKDVSSWAASAVGGLVKRGIISGSDGLLNPKNVLSRAEFATIMANIVSVYCNTNSVPAQQTINGNVLISYGGLTLKDKVINGDLFITEGCGSSGLTLSNTVVNGNIYVRAGGDRALNLINSSSVSSVVISGSDIKSGVITDETSSVKQLNIEDSKGSVAISGNLNNIVCNAANTIINITDCTASSLSINSNAKVNLDVNSQVSELSINPTSYGNNITSLATIKNLNINSSNSIYSLGGKLSNLTVKGSRNTINFLDNTICDKASLSGNNSINLAGTFSDLSSSNSFSGVTFADDFKLDNFTITKDNQLPDGYEKFILGTITLAYKDSNFKFTGDAEQFIIDEDAKGSIVTFAKGSVKNVENNAENVTINVLSGVTIDEITTLEKGLKVQGEGVVKYVIADGNGNNTKVTTKNTTVKNISCSSVYAGNTLVSKGDAIKTTGKPDDAPSDMPEDDDTSEGQSTYSLTLYSSYDGNSETRRYSYVSGKEFALPSPSSIFTDVSGTAAGWSEDRNSSIEYRAGDTYKMPSKNTNLYAIWEVDSGGVTTNNDFTLKYPINAYPSDLTNDSSYSLDMFTSGITVTENSDIQYSLSGTLKYIEEFKHKDMSNSGYYLPLVIPSVSSDFEVIVTDCTGQREAYTRDDIIKSGINYNNTLVIFLKLDYVGTYINGEMVKKVTVSYNSNRYNPYSIPKIITLDYSGINFSSTNDDIVRLQNTTGAPLLVNGTPSKTDNSLVYNMQQVADKVYTFDVTAANVPECDYQNKKGHYVGLNFISPTSKDANLVVKYADGTTKQLTANNSLASIYFDVTDESGKLKTSETITIHWVDSKGSILTQDEKITINFKDIKLLDTSDIIIGTSPITLGQPTTNEYNKYFVDLFIDKSDIANGIFNITASLKNVSDSYKIPLTISVETDTGKTIYAESELFSKTQLQEVEDGHYSTTVLLDVTNKLTGQFLLNITENEVSLTTVKLNINSKVSPIFYSLENVLDKPNLVSEYNISNSLINATLNKATIDDQEGYYLPVKLSIGDTNLTDWKLVINNLTYTVDDVEDGYIITNIYLGSDFNTIKSHLEVSILNSQNKLVASNIILLNLKENKQP